MTKETSNLPCIVIAEHLSMGQLILLCRPIWAAVCVHMCGNI